MDNPETKSRDDCPYIFFPEFVLSRKGTVFWKSSRKPVFGVKHRMGIQMVVLNCDRGGHRIIAVGVGVFPATDSDGRERRIHPNRPSG
jgi:hypothetical protein